MREDDAPEQRLGAGRELDRLRAVPPLGMTVRDHHQRVEGGRLDGHLHLRVRLRRQFAFDHLRQLGVAVIDDAQPGETGQHVDPARRQKRFAQALPQTLARPGQAGVERRRGQLRENETVLVVGCALAFGALEVPHGSRRGATPGGLRRRGAQRLSHPRIAGRLAPQQMRRRGLGARALLDQRGARGSVQAISVGRRQAIADRRGEPPMREPAAARCRQPRRAQRLPRAPEFTDRNARGQRRHPRCRRCPAPGSPGRSPPRAHRFRVRRVAGGPPRVRAR